MSTPAFAIGIDLGTSNSALAWVALADPEAISAPFSLRQQVRADAQDRLTTLPSFLYFSTKETAPLVAGVFAREQATLEPDQVAHSAKSWLCHPWVDREGRLLPWQSSTLPPARRISPVTASALFLQHLRHCWDEAHPDAPLHQQQVVLTVPASFDPAAQQLTLEAAWQAGFPKETLLLEEPQAAFIRWLEAEPRRDNPLQLPENPCRVLVCDIGGGTTDFSLFRVDAEDQWRVQRLAVSDHLLLGGDNIDRWLALRFRETLEQQGPPLTARQWGFLLSECRRLKETLLTENAAVPPAVSLPASGAGLFATHRSVPVDAEALRADLLESFYPLCAADVHPLPAKAGLRAAGLPYAADPAVTHHLAAFLRERGPVHAVLFNGGSLLSPQVRERLLTAITAWQQGLRPVCLPNPEADLAVARGAAAYGAHLHHHRSPIEGGSPRALYLELLDRATREHTLVCILPMGSLPERPYRLSGQTFTTLVEAPVRFQLFSSTRRSEDQLGDLIPISEEGLQPLPAMQTLIRLPEKGPKPANAQVKVQIESRTSLNGLLQVQLVSADPAWKVNHQWDLLFNLRAPVPMDPDEAEAAPARLQPALEAIRRVYGKKASGEARDARHLAKQLETLLARPRSHWDQHTCRSLWPALVEGITRRNRSADHEAAWLSLAGFILRPGFGADLDSFRIQQLWRLHELGLAFPRESRNKTQLWILWRRLAGGLDAPQQALLADAHLGPMAHSGPHPPELLRLAGALERIDIPRRIAWMETLLRILESPRPQNAASASAAAWALGRMLSRIPFGGGPESVLPPETVAEAFTRLETSADWSLTELRQAFLQAARITEEPSLNLTPMLRDRLIERLQAHGADAETLLPLQQLVVPEAADHTRMFGESLPAGLLL